MSSSRLLMAVRTKREAERAVVSLYQLAHGSCLQEHEIFSAVHVIIPSALSAYWLAVSSSVWSRRFPSDRKRRFWRRRGWTHDLMRMLSALVGALQSHLFAFRSTRIRMTALSLLHALIHYPDALSTR